jgi:hypothetical protein
MMRNKQDITVSRMSRRDIMLVENRRLTPRIRPVWDGMWVRSSAHSVPPGRFTGGLPVSTNILSLTGRLCKILLIHISGSQFLFSFNHKIFSKIVITPCL